MQIPDPIAPYVGLIRAALWVLLAGGLFVAGCNHGKDSQAQKYQRQISVADLERDKAKAEAKDNLRDANACGALLADVNRQTQRQIDDAARAKSAAEQAADRAEQAAKASQSRATAAEKALQAAKTTPICRSQLEMALCADIPLL